MYFPANITRAKYYVCYINNPHAGALNHTVQSPAFFFYNIYLSIAILSQIICFKCSHIVLYQFNTFFQDFD